MCCEFACEHIKFCVTGTSYIRYKISDHLKYIHVSIAVEALLTCSSA